MNRKAASGLMLTLLLVAMLTFILHPIHATPATKGTPETPTDGEPLYKQPSLTNHTPQWNQTYGGTGWEWAFSVVEIADGGYALGGYTWSFGAGRSDFWLVKTDANGNEEWNQTYGGEDREYGRCVIQTGDGGYALAGHTTSYGAGGYDFWLVKLAAPCMQATRVFFNINPNPTTPGQTITLKGVLIDAHTNPVGDEAVRVYAKRLGASFWSYITFLTTDNYGIFTWQVTVPWMTPAGIYLFAVYYPGSETYESCYNFDVLAIQ